LQSSTQKRRLTGDWVVTTGCEVIIVTGGKALLPAQSLGQKFLTALFCEMVDSSLAILKDLLEVR